MHNKKISVVIRSKNEEKWIQSCLFAVLNQDYPDFEIVLVDNESSDLTLEIANSYGCKILTISERDFNFSRALNMGIQASSGELIAILSGHCIPSHEQWLIRMAIHFKNEEVVAVYGRQEPLPNTSAFDKRDLWITFGLDRKIQKQDYFFHNANSMLRKRVWEKIPFSERINGVEDQDWAKKILKKQKIIIYEPSATVYHHHGIHHNRSEDRATRVVRMIESIQQDLT